MEKVLEDLACHDKELSILLTDDRHIAALNRAYLDRKGPTNVLAFPMAGGEDPEVVTPMMGDVVISLETALKEAGAVRESLDRTVDRLLIHGILHLLGYDHERTPQQAERMQKEEERLLHLIGALS